jgi:alkanesulfonate monooxygenase SsuD/methylene tetrahydromethanopterin reductase-like flavin-dependent oxidoreductase (luciferase family)
MSYTELQENYHLVVGSPETVIKKLRHIKDRLGVGALLLEAQGGRLSHEDTMRSLELFGKEVIPALKD